MNPVEIRLDSVDTPDVARLLQEHLEEMHRLSPPGSVHALDLRALREPAITLWSAWKGADLLGCGALKELGPEHGEIKSMRTSSAHVRTGVASALLRHILEEAGRRGYRRISLETGSDDAFAPARALYARFGFLECGPFGTYVEDPHSTFMTLQRTGRTLPADQERRVSP